MTLSARFLAALLPALLAAPAAAQPAQEYSFPGTPSATGGMSPPSTLRITETPGAPAQAPAIVRDTPESLQQYTLCRNKSDREAVSREQMRAGTARCLQELEARRRQAP